MNFCKSCKEQKLNTTIMFGNCECVSRLNCCNANFILNTLHVAEKCNVCKNDYTRYQLRKIENYIRIINYSLDTTDYETLFHNMNDYYQELINQSLDYIHNFYSLTITDLNKLNIVNIIKMYLEEDFVDYFLEKYHFVQLKHYESI